MTSRSPASKSRSPRRRASVNDRFGAARKLHRHHRSQSANVRDFLELRLHGAQRGIDSGTDRARPRKKSFIHDVEDRQCGGAGDRIAGKRTAEPAGLGRVHDLGPADHRRQWKAAAKRFRDRDDVRLELVMLARKKSAGTAESGLDLVGNENDAALASDARQLFEETCGRRHEAAFTEDRFDDDGGDLIGGDLAFKELVECR